MSQPAVLACHGFPAMPKTLGHLKSYLERAGLTYEIPALRGHATVYTDLIGVQWQDWVADGLSAYDRLAAQSARVAVVGHSMGALVAAHVAAARPADSLTLVAPALKFSHPLAPLGGVLAPLLKVWKSAPPVLWDATLLEALNGDPVTYDRFPTAAFAQLWAFAKLTPEVLARVTTRALVIHSRRDETIPPAAAALALEQLGSRDKRLQWFANSRHEMFCDGERDALCAAILEFVLKS